MAKNLLLFTYFFLFWSRDMLAVLRNHGYRDTGAHNCTIHPPSVTVPCTQYTFQGYEYCVREKLRTKFPELYEIEREQVVTWPGSPTDIETNTTKMLTITWRPRRDGSIRHLIGFEVMLEGISFANFGKTICAVVDLIGMEDHIMLWLLNATFEFQINAPGDFDVVITSLPLPPKMYAQDIKENVILEKSDEVYHPNISVKIMVVQINATSVNVSVDVTPDAEDVIAYVLEVYYESSKTDVIPERIVTTISSMQKFAMIGNLRVGNYTIKVRPENKFPWDSSRCACYTGHPSRRSCELCATYIKYFQVEVVKEIFDEVSNNKFLQIGVPSIAAFILVFLILSMGMFLGRKRTHTCHTTTTATEKNSIYVLHAVENDAHENAVVKAFLKYLRNRYNCAVTSHVEIQEETIVADKLHEYLITTNLIIIIHSKAAYKLYHINRKETQCLLSGSIGPVDDTFRFCIATLVNEQHSCLKNKTISIRFDFTPLEFVIEEFSLNVYNLIDDLEKLNQHLQKKFYYKEDPGESSHEELSESIRVLKLFQSPNSDRLDTKVSKSLISVKEHSDISLSTQRCSKYSTPDIYKYSCRDDNNENNKLKDIKGSTCRMHLYRSASMQTMNSYYVSEAERRFICPEFDEESENTLTDQMKAINDRYRFNLDHEFDSNDDCFTILGTSV